MNYEKFNDMMCKIRQAEEEFNKKLEEAIKPFIDEMNKQQKEDDGNYYKGLNDMHEAVRLIATDGSDGGMSILELKDAFGTASVCDIVLGYSPMEIMDKTLAWITKRKESQEFHVGDEVTIPGCAGFAYIILYRIYETEDLFKLIEPTSLLTYTYSAKSLMKTGKHYDSIPLPKS